MKRKNDSRWEVVNPNKIVSDYKDTLKSVKNNVSVFRSDLNYIYDTLYSCDELLTEFLFNSPSSTLICLHSDIKDIVEILRKYKQSNLF